MKIIKINDPAVKAAVFFVGVSVSSAAVSSLSVSGGLQVL